MKKFDFRLESVLRVRRLLAERERIALISAQAEVAAADTALQNRREALATEGRALNNATGSSLKGRAEQIARHQREVTNATEALNLAAGAAETKNVDWAAASQRVKAIERLSERDHESWTVESKRVEQKDTDDIANARQRHSSSPQVLTKRATS